MRILILILIIGVVIVIGGVATGFLNVSQIRSGKAPEVIATKNGITARGGQAPAFDVETGSVKVGTKETTVKVPAIVVQKPDRNQNQAAANAM